MQSSIIVGRVHRSQLKLERPLYIVGNDLFDNLVALPLSRSPPYRRVVIIWHNKITTLVLPYLQSSIIVGRVHRSQLKLERPLYIVGNDLFDNLVALPLSRSPPYRRVVIIWHNKITTLVLPYLQSLIIVGRVHSTALKLERPLYIFGNDLFYNPVAFLEAGVLSLSSSFLLHIAIE